MSWEDVIGAWKTASNDLQLSVEVPLSIQMRQGIISVPMLIKSFGTTEGTIILEFDRQDELSQTLSQFGYYCSFLNPEVYGNYNRQKFIEALEDWGYFGNDKNKPVWYKGRNYAGK
jgi:hypothetical protein